jgi:hypothetical protein
MNNFLKPSFFSNELENKSCNIYLGISKLAVPPQSKSEINIWEARNICFLNSWCLSQTRTQKLWHTVNWIATFFSLRISLTILRNMKDIFTSTQPKNYLERDSHLYFQLNTCLIIELLRQHGLDWWRVHHFDGFSVLWAVSKASPSPSVTHKHAPMSETLASQVLFMQCKDKLQISNVAHVLCCWLPTVFR